MTRNVKAKTPTRRGKSVLPNSVNGSLLTRHHTRSIFQPGISPKKSKGRQKTNTGNVKAVIEQASFSGIVLRVEVLVDAHTDIWTKLPLEWEDGQAPIEPFYH